VTHRWSVNASPAKYLAVKQRVAHVSYGIDSLGPFSESISGRFGIFGGPISEYPDGTDRHAELERSATTLRLRHGATAPPRRESQRVRPVRRPARHGDRSPWKPAVRSRVRVAHGGGDESPRAGPAGRRCLSCAQLRRRRPSLHTPREVFGPAQSPLAGAEGRCSQATWLGARTARARAHDGPSGAP
jgi:hypothetical protein